MARPGDIFESEITHSTVRDAILQIMQGDLARAGIVDPNKATEVAANITRSVQKMGFRGASSAMLSGNSAFHTLVTQHLGSPAAAAYDPQFRQQLLQAIDRANITGSDYIAGVKARIQIGLAQYAALSGEGRASDAGLSGEGRKSGLGYKTDLPITYSPDNLSTPLRSLVDSSRGISAGHVAEAANFAQRIGVEPGPYTGYFTGSSQSMRTAIERHIKHGENITNDHIKNAADIKTILGAVKSGAVKREKLTPELQNIIKEMEAKGLKLDKVDPKAIDKYLQDNPKVLEQLKKANDKDTAAKAGQTTAQIVAEDKAADAKLKAAAPKPAGGPVQTQGTLDLKS